jgi:hypothetical protein
MHRMRFTEFVRAEVRAGRPVIGAGLIVCCLACSSRAASAPSPAQRSGDESWKVTFRMSGGFAGFRRELEVSSSGAATATDEKRRQRVTAQVPGDELLFIGSLVTAAKPSEASRPGSCRDCLEYDIEITSAGRRVTVRANDATLAGSDASRLVDALRRLQDRLLSQQGR